MKDPMKDEDSFNEEDKLITETGKSFRDSVSNIDSSGKRVWVSPTKPKGKFHRARAVVAYTILAIFFVLPFIKYQGEQFFLLDILERKFIIFGKVLWPQDFYLLALGIIAALVFVVLFTAVYGRIFCGWACPQTIFLEMVFRKIEFLIEGGPSKQKKLNSKPWNPTWIFKKTAKFSIFMAMSFIVNAFAISYLMGMDNMIILLTEFPANMSGWAIFLISATLAFFFIMAWFREQACCYVCPYGRLQSVLLDKNSIIVNYDYRRGEPREKTKNRTEESGDCIDCGACVRVCPTGIDIRNGVQLECVNCTACMDSCDDVMDKTKKPKGLIRYASINNIEEQTKFKFTPRIIFYTIVLFLLVSVWTTLFINRSEVELNMLRAKGSNFFLNQDGTISNLYTMKLINKTLEEMDLKLLTENYTSSFKLVGVEKLHLKANEQIEANVIITIPQSEIKKKKNELIISLTDGKRVVGSIETSFSGPAKKN